MPNFFAETDLANTAAIRGTHQGDGSSGVFGEAKRGPGVSGSSATSVGVDAKSANGPAALRAVHAGDGPGVLGASKFNGVLGRSSGETGFARVRSEATGGPGVSGESANSVGVDAKSQAGPAALRAVHAGGGPGVLGIGGKLGIIGESAAGVPARGRPRRSADDAQLPADPENSRTSPGVNRPQCRRPGLALRVDTDRVAHFPPRRPAPPWSRRGVGRNWVRPSSERGTPLTLARGRPARRRHARPGKHRRTFGGWRGHQPTVGLDPETRAPSLPRRRRPRACPGGLPRIAAVFERFVSEESSARSTF